MVLRLAAAETSDLVVQQPWGRPGRAESIVNYQHKAKRSPTKTSAWLRDTEGTPSLIIYNQQMAAGLRASPCHIYVEVVRLRYDGLQLWLMACE